MTVSAKRASNRIIYHAKNEALKCNLQKNKADFTNIFLLAKKIRHNNQDVVGEKPVLNDTGTLSLDDLAKKAAWREYYVRLINHEFPWDKNNLSDVLSLEGPSPLITNDMIRKAVCKMFSGKAAGPSGVVSERIKASGGAGIELIRDLINAIIAQNCIPSDWQYSYIVNLYKGKGDALVRGNYRGLKLMDHEMKTLESVVEALIVTDFCYLGDMISAGGGCELSSITRCKSAWSKFRQLFPILTNLHLLFTTSGQIYNTYIRAVMLYSSETWSLTTPFLNRLKRNDLAMIRWICKARVEAQFDGNRPTRPPYV